MFDDFNTLNKLFGMLL
ncbi:hypothetical protein D049_2021A, partial [Vibrio parahaemolyticus VPTS-2010]